MAYVRDVQNDDAMHADSGPPEEAQDLHLEFLDGLPDDEFSPEEESLRDAILDVLTRRGPRSLEQIITQREVGLAVKAFAPGEYRRSYNFLPDWIDRRIGGEVELVRPQDTLRHDKLWIKKVMLRLFDDDRPLTAPPLPEESPHFAQSGSLENNKTGVGRGKSSEAWLESLPPGSFLQPEIDLREAILDFLAMWRNPRRAFVRDLEVHPPLRAICAYLFPPGVMLADWIEHRVGAEVEILHDGSINLRGGADVIVQQKCAYFAEMERRNAYSHGALSGPGKGPMLDGSAPPLDIPPNVKPIRKMLEKGVRKDPEAFARPMTFSDLKRLMDSLGVYFPIGQVAKVAEEIGEASPAAVVRRYCQDLVKFSKPGKKTENAIAEKKEIEGGRKRTREEESEAHGGEQEDETKKRRRQRARREGNIEPESGGAAPGFDTFFAALPSDELLPGEVAFAEKLRECNGMDLSKAQMLAVLEKNMLLQDVYGEPKGRLPLKKWIETRVADYVMIEAGSGGAQTLKAVDGMLRSQE